MTTLTIAQRHKDALQGLDFEIHVQLDRIGGGM